MKKLILLFLLLPLLVLGQLTSSTDGIDIDLNFVSTTLGETDIAKVQVNDTIILKSVSYTHLTLPTICSV